MGGRRDQWKDGWADAWEEKNQWQEGQTYGRMVGMIDQWDEGRTSGRKLFTMGGIGPMGERLDL